MSVSKIKIFSFTMALSIGSGVFLMGCSSSDPDSSEPVQSQTTGGDSMDDMNEENMAGSLVTEFDGSWQSDCIEYRLFDIPEEDQPGGYVHRTLTIDSSAGTYSERRQIFTDMDCATEDPDRPATGVSGQIVFDGTTMTSSGLEATIVRYTDNGAADLVGLLYREDNVLYRELRESTLIEDIVPTELGLSNPWRLVL